MTQTKPITAELLESLTQFNIAAKNLKDSWENNSRSGDELSKQYPFQYSFDEIVGRIDDWYISNIPFTFMVDGNDPVTLEVILGANEHDDSITDEIRNLVNLKVGECVVIGAVDVERIS